MSLGPDLHLDPGTHDLARGQDGGWYLAVDLSQAIKIALLTFVGEWFRDPSVGVPYFERFFQKPARLDHLRSIVTAQIQAVTGVAAVESVVLDLDSERHLSISWTARASSGDLVAGALVTP